MSVIFKEKNYDQLLIVVNKLLIIVLSIFILLTAFNLITKARVDGLKNDLELLQGEELKYRTLLKDLKTEKKVKKVENKKYSLLISLADCADQINYSSLHLKNNKLYLKAVSAKQNSIFTLIEALEDDDQFKEVDLMNINQREDYYFELEILLRQ